VQTAEARAKQAGAELDAARKTERELREKLERIDKDYQDARDEYLDHKRQLTSARAAVEKSQEECGHIWHELPDVYQRRISTAAVANWLTTSYPKEADLEALRVQVRGLAPARGKLREAEKAQQSWSQLKAQESQALDGLNRLLRDLPADRQAIRRQHADLEAEQMALFKSMDAHRSQVGEVEREIERLTRERDFAHGELSQMDTRLKQQQLVRQNAERNIQVHLKALPAAWQAQGETVGLRELHTLTDEQKHLEDDGTDERSRELEHARHNVAVLEQDVRQLEKQEAAMPAEARQDRQAIAALLKEARRVDQERDDALAQARQRLALLEDYQKQRQELDREYRELEAGLQSDRLLAELLGRDRLQLYLVREAERQVVEYANAVLDRLSGGQLYLKLSGEANGDGASAKALDLEAYNRATGERPINVAFLSGSQKFRVAVSLALGIGQYASRQHRPIESVIIDEGFGCLDSQGRQVMIQELQNLRSQMRCILLVSHQEDFAESFSDGYHFHLENGATRVKRFQK
jgi:DNA repair exonuclease SbcCD ATPase subunit